jgi:hypothetical protein
MPRRPEARVAVSIRLRPELVARLKTFVRDQAGQPLYLTLSTCCEAAIERHLAYLTAELEGQSATPRRTSPSQNHRR